MFFKHILRKNSMPQYLLFNCKLTLLLQRDLTSPSSNCELISYLISTCEPITHPPPIVKLSLTFFPPANLSLTLFLVVKLSLTHLRTYAPLPAENLSLSLTFFQMWIYLSVSPSSNCEFISRSHPLPSVNLPLIIFQLWTYYLVISHPLHLIYHLSNLNISRIFFSTLNLSRTFFPSGILSPTFFSTLNCSLWLSILYIYLSMGYF